MIESEDLNPVGLIAAMPPDVRKGCAFPIRYTVVGYARSRRWRTVPGKVHCERYKEWAQPDTLSICAERLSHSAHQAA